MKRLIFLILLLAFAISIQAQEPEFVEFRDEEQLMSGIVPADWDYMTDGNYRRHATSRDVTGLDFSSSYYDMDFVLGETAYRMELETMPEANSQIEGVVNWNVWHFPGEGRRSVDTTYAVAEYGRLIYQIRMTSSSEEQAELYESVFVPVVTAFTPLDESFDFVSFRNDFAALTGIMPSTWAVSSSADFLYIPSYELYHFATQMSISSVDMDMETALGRLARDNGLTELPEPYTELQGYLLWDLRQLERVREGLTISYTLATAEYDGQVYVAILFALQEDHDGLLESVFVPVVRSLLPFDFVVEMEAFSSEEFGIQGLIPTAWSRGYFNYNGYLRLHGESDVTLLWIESDDGTTDDLIERLHNLLSIQEITQVNRSIEGNMTWELRRIDRDARQGHLVIWLATTEYAGRTYFVFLESIEAEHFTLYEKVFVPVVESISRLN